MIKMAKNINKYINKWLRRHGFDCTAKLGSDFEYDCINSIITYSFVVPQAHDDLFLSVCQEISDQLVECDTFVLSFFHELGHFMTEDEITTKQYKKYDKLVLKNLKKKKLKEKDYKKYYYCPVEYVATEWAVNYIVTHPKQINQFLKHIQKLEKKFLKENDVDLTEEI